MAQKESRRNEAIFTINVFRTKSSFLINGPQVQKFLLELLPVVQSWATENTVDINIKDEKLKNVLSKMKIVQTPIIKNKQKQETTREIQNQNTEGEELDFVIDRENNEERQKVEEGNSTQVLPAQTNELEINRNSNDKDLNKQTDNNKTEDNAIENIHDNKKASNENKTATSTESKTDKKEESNYEETTSKSEIEKEKDITNKTNKAQLEETKDTGNVEKTLQNRAKTQTQKNARENITKESMEQAQILEIIDK